MDEPTAYVCANLGCSWKGRRRERTAALTGPGQLQLLGQPSGVHLACPDAFPLVNGPAD